MPSLRGGQLSMAALPPAGDGDSENDTTEVAFQGKSLPPSDEAKLLLQKNRVATATLR